jgi:hypothetical protein
MALRKIPHPEEAAKRPSRRTDDADPAELQFFHILSAFRETDAAQALEQCLILQRCAARHRHQTRSSRRGVDDRTHRTRSSAAIEERADQGC